MLFKLVRLIIFVFCLNISLSHAEDWPSLLRMSQAIVCDEIEQAREILDMYQSEGAESAAKVFARLVKEKNNDGDSKCVLTPGVYIMIKEEDRLVITDSKGDYLGFVLQVYDPRLKAILYLFVTKRLNDAS